LSATDALHAIRITDSNAQEVKVVASVLNYRMCRLHLHKLDLQESKIQFDRHIAEFSNLDPNQELFFEELAWLEQEYVIININRLAACINALSLYYSYCIALLACC